MSNDQGATPPIRRGKGLRLSTQGQAEEADRPQQPEPPQLREADEAHRPRQPGPAEAADQSKTPAGAPSRRRGLRLSTSAPATDAATPEAQAPSGDPAPGVTQTVEASAALVPTPGAAPEATLSAAQRRIATARGPISYVSSGAGRPLLLIHGFGATGRIWDGARGALGDLRTAYAIDLPGFGASPPRPHAPTLAALADDVTAWADALGLDEFDLLGHSLGAAVAAVVAARRPERVGRLVAVSLGARRFAPELSAVGLARGPIDLTLGLARPLLDLWQPVNRAVLQSPAMAVTIGALVLHGPPATPGPWRAYLADHAAADPRAYLTSLAAPGDPTLLAALPAIVAPTLCVAGREDRVARLAETTTAQSLIAGSGLALIDGCGHLPMLERPEELHLAVRAFLSYDSR